MKSRVAPRALVTALLVAFSLAGVARGEPTVTQTFTLYPGWNPVFLSVQPDPDEPAAVFEGVPVESVWAYSARLSSAEFIQDPDEGVWSQPGWHAYFPEGRPDAFLTGLHAIVGNRAYLVKLGGTETVTWTVTGRPQVPRIRWEPDSYNLVGFPVDPEDPPTLGGFLSASAAHAGQPVYRIGEQGVWVPMAPSDLLRAGVAYWVYCEGGSDFVSPLVVEADPGRGLDFGATVDQQVLPIRNLGDGAATVTLGTLSGGDGAVVHKVIGEDGLTAWPSLPASVEVAAGERAYVTVAVRRALFEGGELAEVMEVRDGRGSRWLIPLTATAPEHSSLWVGSVTVTAVGELNADPGAPTPTGSEFSFRIIVHVDGQGQARLLKEFIRVWEDGTAEPSGENPGEMVVAEPGRTVILTDDTLIPRYQGTGLRGGQAVGRRVSTAAYDFAGNTLPMTGGVGPGGTLECVIEVPSDLPTNPFRHKYHPDHDNLDEQRREFVPEAYAVTRRIQLRFTQDDPERPAPSSPNPPGWGYSVVGGVYRETLSGLHRRDITVEGTFRLQLASMNDELNQ